MAEWRVLGASVLINCLAKGSLKSLGVVMVELKHQGVDTAQAAWVPAIAYTLFSCLSTPVARLTCLLSPRSITALGGLLASLGLLLSSQFSSLLVLYLGLGLCLGAGACMATILGVLEINKKFTGSRRGLAHGWGLAGSTLGGLLLPGALAFLVASWGYSGALLLQAGLLLHIVPAALLYSGQKEVEVARGEGQRGAGGAKVWRNSRLWLCIFSTASTTIGYTNFGLYLPLHLVQSHNLTPTVAASFLSLFALGDLCGRMTGPALSDWAPPRWTWYCGGLAGAGGSMLAVAASSQPLQVGAATLVAGVCSGVFVGVYPALLSDELGAENLPVTYPLSQTLAGVLNLAGPPLLGVLADRMNTTMVMLTLGSSLIVGALPLFLASMIRLYRSIMRSVI